MVSELKSRAIPSRILSGLEIEHNPECYLGALDAVFRFNGDTDGSLINHQLGFCYWAPGSGKAPPVIAGFGRGEAERMVEAVSGISIRWNTQSTWELFLDALGTTLSHGQPLLVFVDTFFLSQFAKRKGHLPHAVLIHGYDSATDSILIKSAVPFQWKMRLNDLRPACQSNSIAGGSPITWVDIRFPSQSIRPIASEELLQNALANMRRKPETASCVIGLSGIRKFAEEFSKQSFAGSEPFSSVCQAFGTMIPSIFHQRQRFVGFLTKVLGEADELCRTYSHLATQWEIFANACLKLGFIDAPHLRERLKCRLQSLADEEEMALRLVEEKRRWVKSVCVQES